MTCVLACYAIACYCFFSGSWWSSSRGTVRVAVSLERLQASVIRAALPPNRAPVGVPLGAGVGAGGVARAAVQEAKGEEVMPPAELSCKVCYIWMYGCMCGFFVSVK